MTHIADPSTLTESTNVEPVHGLALSVQMTGQDIPHLLRQLKGVISDLQQEVQGSSGLDEDFHFCWRLSPLHEPVRLTKKAISEFLVWSSSRANEYSKAEAVDIIYRILQGSYLPAGSTTPVLEMTLNTGAFSQRGHASGRRYRVDARTKTLYSLGESDKVVSQIVFM